MDGRKMLVLHMSTWQAFIARKNYSNKCVLFSRMWGHVYDSYIQHIHHAVAPRSWALFSDSNKISVTKQSEEMKAVADEKFTHCLYIHNFWEICFDQIRQNVSTARGLCQLNSDIKWTFIFINVRQFLVQKKKSVFLVLCSKLKPSVNMFAVCCCCCNRRCRKSVWLSVLFCDA